MFYGKFICEYVVDSQTVDFFPRSLSTVELDSAHFTFNRFHFSNFSEPTGFIIKPHVIELNQIFLFFHPSIYFPNKLRTKTTQMKLDWERKCRMQSYNLMYSSI